ncbi:glycoside hydrolase family 18 protein [Cellulomonas edaphi]|uniref:chitinase n=1 Tax=Cellulomonas edaphi TaxID=3053468 RepID=A0ABT7SA49_9CELL|nr:glycoside hydrolase family 18 protein [Cellulomons edaphi]MDM7832501.1 glycoside hydrolase family 18 protein [Cellulomons edaphi]
MLRPRRLSMLAAVALGATVALVVPQSAQAAPKPAPDGPSKVVTAYFADWDVYGRGYYVKDIPATKLNVIQYAFGVPGYDPATGKASCDVLDPWADYQQVYWGGENTVDGVADDPSNPDQHLFGNFNQLRKLKAANPHLKVEISLGGWTKSTWFSTLASTPQLRRDFVSSCIDTFIKGNLPAGGWPEGAGGPGAAAGIFDGIDIDWEYPTQVADGNVNPGPADRHNATLLAAEFRRQLDAYGKTTGKHYLLTAALPAATSATKYFELKQISKYFDWDNVMTYDFNVASGPVAAHNTLFTPDPRDPNHQNPTWNTAGTVAYYLLHGVPANKIVVGVPFYAQQYLRTSTKNNGLYSAFDNTGTDSNSLVVDVAPQPTYHALVDEGGYVNSAGTVGGAGYTAFWNPLAGEPYLFNPAAEHPNLTTGAATVPTVIAYSSPRSIGERTTLIKALNLRGAMAWEISQDSNDHALISALSPLLK